MTARSTPSFDALPLFAGDDELAAAIVGRARAAQWKREMLPRLERLPGFPKVDAVHGGRAVPLVRLFYVNYLHLPKDGRGLPDGEEDESAWTRSRRRA